jgi:adenylate kinase family enzyme
MSLRIIKATEPLKVERLNLCIYGPPGVGKTTLAFSAEDPLLLDFDKGAHRSKNRKDTVPISSWSDVTSMTQEDLAPYKTVIADTAGRALDFLTGDIIKAEPKLGRGGALTLQGYGTLKSRFIAWKNLLNTFGKDLILICHMDEQRNGDEMIERLDVQGGSKGEIYKSADAMGRIFIRDKKRVLDFSPRENAFGKNPCGLDVLTLPEPSSNGRFLAELIATMKTRLNELSVEQKQAQDVMDAWVEAIAGYNSVDDFNKNIGEVKKLSQAIQFAFAGRAKTLNFVYSKDAKRYEAPHVETPKPPATEERSFADLFA